MRARKRTPIAPPDLSDQVKVQSLSRPAVLTAMGAILTVTMIAVFISSAGSMENEENQQRGQGQEADVIIESGSLPPILRDDEGPFEAHIAAMNRARRDTRADTTDESPAGDSEADSLARARAATMDALLERMQAMKEQGQHADLPIGENGLGGTTGRQDAARRFYQEQLEQRHQAGALNRSARSAPARGDDPAARHLEAVRSSPIIMNTGAPDSEVEGTPTGDSHVDLLRTAQQMAEQRGDGEMSQMLASLSEHYEEAAGAGPGDGVSGSGVGSMARIGPDFGPSDNSGRQRGRGAIVQVEPPRSPYEIKQGAIIPAILETAVNSDLPGGVRARTTRNVYDSRTQQHLLIPKNSILVGSSGSSASGGTNRLAIAWERVILPDGRSINLGGQETKDGSGASGLTGDVDHHHFRRFTSALLVSLVGAGVKIATYDDRGAYGYGPPSIGQVVGSGAAEQTADVTTEVLRRGMNVQPTVTVPAGQSLQVYVNQDLAFGTPYSAADGYLSQW